MNDVDEPIHVVEYEQRWPHDFAMEQLRLASSLGIPTDRIEHIGSTAVVNLLAKPVIDIMIGTDNWPPDEAVIEQIQRSGYQALGEAGVSERLYFRARGAANFNVHLVSFGGRHWFSNLALRDYLRNSQSARDRYAQVKRDAAASGIATLLAYSAFKAAVVGELLHEALKRAHPR
jgi:GrpB-like predicted nucleotidyltransferase (UPF0157 family)